MNKLMLIACLTISFFGVNAQIDGVWADSSSASFTNCTAVFAVKGDSVFVTHYLEFNGKPFVEYGKGIKTGNKYVYNVVVTTQIPGWSTAGTHTLVLSEDKRTLRGTYADNKGGKGALVFKKLYPKK